LVVRKRDDVVALCIKLVITEIELTERVDNVELEGRQVVVREIERVDYGSICRD
jgi:hypothetical protein